MEIEQMELAHVETPLSDLDIGNILNPEAPTSEGHKNVDNLESKPDTEDISEPETHHQENADDDAQEQPQSEDSEAQSQSQDAQDRKSADDLIEITVADGTKQKVSLDDLKSGYLMQSDYTRKTTELEKEREQLQQSYTQLEAQFLQSAQALLTRYNPISHLKSQREALVKEAIEAREIADDVTFTAKRLDLFELDKQIEQIEREVQTLFQAAEHQSATMTAKQIAAEREALFAAIPELDKPEKQKEFREATYKALQKVGYTEEQMRQMSNSVDAKQAQLAYYAGKYFEMQNAAPQVAKKIQDKVVTPKPSSSPTRQGVNTSLLDTLKRDPNNELAIGALLKPF